MFSFYFFSGGVTATRKFLFIREMAVLYPILECHEKWLGGGSQLEFVLERLVIR